MGIKKGIDSLAPVIVLLVILASCGSDGDAPTAADSDTQVTTPVAQVEATPTATATSTPTSTPTATATATATAEPTNTPTPVPPTATPTSTPIPPTATPVPPTATPTPIQPTPTREPDGQDAQVVEIIDGDTIDVVMRDQRYRVRLIGIDTPETKDPNSPVMCYGQEATAKTTELIERAGWRVYLEMDVSDTDRYGRLLRYVWLPHPDGTRMLNYELVAGGYAQVSTYPPDVKYTDWFREAQQQAQAEGRGLWGACGSFGVPDEPPTPTPVSAAPAPPSTGSCDPAYPDVCIPPIAEAGDLDCGDIPHRRFTVLPPDPHGLDGRDNDGIGCES